MRRVCYSTAVVKRVVFGIGVGVYRVLSAASFGQCVGDWCSPMRRKGGKLRIPLRNLCEIGFLRKKFCVRVERSTRSCLRSVLILSGGKKKIHSVSVTAELNISGPDIDRTVGLLHRSNCVTVSHCNAIALLRGKTRVTGRVCRHRVILTEVLRKLKIPTRVTVRSTYGVRRSVDRRDFRGVGTRCGGFVGGRRATRWRAYERTTKEWGAGPTTYFLFVVFFFF